MPGHRIALPFSMSLALSAVRDSGAKERPPKLSLELQDANEREERTLWPSLPPSGNKTLDIRNETLAIGAGISTLITYRLPDGSDGVVKEYGLLFAPTSLIPAPGLPLTFAVAINGELIAPDLGIAGFYQIFSSDALHPEMLKCTRTILGGETLTFIVNNGTGLGLDLRTRVWGWTYTATGYKGGPRG